MRKWKTNVRKCLIFVTLTGMIFSFCACKEKTMPALAVYSPQVQTSSDKIHFLNTYNSDCIILESQGHVAIIDCAEDSSNPKNLSVIEPNGFENTVVEYVKHYFADSQGKVHVDFILGTHAHSDHIGGFDTLILDEDITIDVAYLKRYYPDRIREKETKLWDNDIVYAEMIDAINARQITLVQDLPAETFKLGNYTVRFLNTKEPETGKSLFENDNSVATYVTLGTQKILLMADVNNYSGDEVEIGKTVGKVDLLKVGHHGYEGSTTKKFVKSVKPTLSIITNVYGWSEKGVRNNLFDVGSLIYSTVSENGIIAAVSEDKIVLYKGSMAY